MLYTYFVKYELIISGYPKILLFDKCFITLTSALNNLHCRLQCLFTIIISFSFIYSPQCKTYTSGTYNPNTRGSDACRGSNKQWTRTLNRNTIAGLPECVVTTMSGTPSETTQDRTQRTHFQAQDRNENV